MIKVKFSLVNKDRKKNAGRGHPIGSVLDGVVVGSPEWDTICTRCGDCCFERVYDEDDRLVASTICEFLDPVTHLCTVYEQRFEVCHDCIGLTDQNLPTFDWLPETCGYVIRFGLHKKGEGK
jgi:uncharacterized protein